MPSTDRQAEASGVRDLVGRLREGTFVPAQTAFVAVDLQILDASADGAHGRRARDAGTFGLVADYFRAVEDRVLPALAQLTSALQTIDVPSIYTVCASRTKSLRDNGRRFEDFGIQLHTDDRDAELLPGIEVRSNDIILTKTTASAFWSTNLERVLRQMDIETVIVAGVVTSGCVESLVRDASDLDFNVVLLADACADRTASLHRGALERLNQNFAHVCTVADVLEKLGT